MFDRDGLSWSMCVSMRQTVPTEVESITRIFFMGSDIEGSMATVLEGDGMVQSKSKSASLSEDMQTGATSPRVF